MNEYIDSLCKKVKITDNANWHKFGEELERDIKRIKVSQEKEAESYDPESLLKLDDKKPKIYDIFKLVADLDIEMTRQEKAASSLVGKGKVENRIPFKKVEDKGSEDGLSYEMRLYNLEGIGKPKPSLYDKYLGQPLNLWGKKISGIKDYSNYLGLSKPTEIKDNKPKQATQNLGGGFNAPKKPDDDQKIEVKKPQEPSFINYAEAFLGIQKANAYTGVVPGGAYGMEFANLLGSTVYMGGAIRAGAAMLNPSILVPALGAGAVYGSYKASKIYGKEMENFIDNASKDELINYTNSLGSDMFESGLVAGSYVAAKAKLAEPERKPIPIWDINKQKEFVFTLDSAPDPKLKWLFSSGENFYRTSIIHQDDRPSGFITIPDEAKIIILGGPIGEIEKPIIIGGGQDLTPQKQEIPVYYPVEQKIIYESRELNEKDLKDPNILQQIAQIKKDFGVSDAKYRIQKDIVIIPETQVHHIIHQALRGHKLIEKSGFDIEDLENRIVLPTKKGAELYEESKRTIHEGKHNEKALLELKQKMDEVMEDSKGMNWSQEKYRQEISKIITEERKLLQSGERALNKNHRFWAK